MHRPLTPPPRYSLLFALRPSPFASHLFTLPRPTSTSPSTTLAALREHQTKKKPLRTGDIFLPRPSSLRPLRPLRPANRTWVIIECAALVKLAPPNRQSTIHSRQPPVPSSRRCSRQTASQLSSPRTVFGLGAQTERSSFYTRHLTLWTGFIANNISREHQLTDLFVVLSSPSPFSVRESPPRNTTTFFDSSTTFSLAKVYVAYNGDRAHVP